MTHRQPFVFLFVSLLALFSLAASAQCVDCKTLADALVEPAGVKTLKDNGNLNDAYLEVLPESIGDLVNVEILYLSDHGISELPETIGQLTKLKELSLAGNQLTSLPDALYSLTNLRELILFDNAFAEKEKKAIRKRVAEEMPKTKLLIN